MEPSLPPLLRLPRSIRDQILDETGLVRRRRIRLCTPSRQTSGGSPPNEAAGGSPRGPIHSLFFVCTQISQEAKEIYFSQNKFYFSCAKGSKLLACVKSLGERNIALMKSIHVDITFSIREDWRNAADRLLPTPIPTSLVETFQMWEEFSKILGQWIRPTTFGAADRDQLLPVLRAVGNLPRLRGLVFEADYDCGPIVAPQTIREFMDSIIKPEPWPAEQGASPGAFPFDRLPTELQLQVLDHVCGSQTEGIRWFNPLQAPFSRGCCDQCRGPEIGGYRPDPDCVPNWFACNCSPLRAFSTYCTCRSSAFVVSPKAGCLQAPARTLFYQANGFCIGGGGGPVEPLATVIDSLLRGQRGIPRQHLGAIPTLALYGQLNDDTDFGALQASLGALAAACPRARPFVLVVQPQADRHQPYAYQVEEKDASGLVITFGPGLARLCDRLARLLAASGVASFVLATTTPWIEIGDRRRHLLRALLDSRTSLAHASIRPGLSAALPEYQTPSPDPWWLPSQGVGSALRWELWGLEETSHMYSWQNGMYGG
jgi:hypothetical protein